MQRPLLLQCHFTAIHNPHPFAHLRDSTAQDLEICAGFGPANPCMTRLLGNTRITAADHFQDTRHIELDLRQHGPEYDPGDILTIFPSQSEAAVTKLLKLLGYQPDCRVRIELAEVESSLVGQHVMEVSLP